MKLILFSFQKSKKVGACEDAPPRVRDDLLLVCDGLGGSGHRILSYTDPESGTIVSRSSAAIGAEIAANTTERLLSGKAQWIFAADTATEQASRLEELVRKLKSQLMADMQAHPAANGGEWVDAATGSELFPTTLAAALYCQAGEGIRVALVWAGDSRIYQLSPVHGLRLLTKDDSQVSAAEMYSSGIMTNCINAGGDYYLNYSLFELDHPSMLLSCSDGCFDYLSSPLHFEWLLLHTVMDALPENADDVTDPGKLLADCISSKMYKRIGDDTTMAGAVIGEDELNRLKAMFEKRASAFDKDALAIHKSLSELRSMKAQSEKLKRRIDQMMMENSEGMVSSIADGYDELYRFISSLDCFSKFERMKALREKEITERCSLKLSTVFEERTSVLKEIAVAQAQDSKHIGELSDKLEKLVSRQKDICDECVKSRHEAVLEIAGRFLENNCEEIYNSLSAQSEDRLQEMLAQKKLVNESLEEIVDLVGQIANSVKRENAASDETEKIWTEYRKGYLAFDDAAVSGRVQ